MMGQPDGEMELENIIRRGTNSGKRFSPKCGETWGEMTLLAPPSTALSFLYPYEHPPLGQILRHGAWALALR